MCVCAHVLPVGSSLWSSAPRVSRHWTDTQAPPPNMTQWNPQSTLAGLYWASKHKTPCPRSETNRNTRQILCVYCRKICPLYNCFLCTRVLYLKMCVWQTDNSVCAVLPDHSPEIFHGAPQRSLAHNELLIVVVSLWKHQHSKNTCFVGKMEINKQFLVGSPWRRRRWCTRCSLTLKRSNTLLIFPLHKNKETIALIHHIGEVTNHNKARVVVHLHLLLTQRRSV